MLMELVGKLRFIKEYGELENVKPGDQAEALTGVMVRALVGASRTGVVSISSFLDILFMFTGENGLV